MADLLTSVKGVYDDALLRYAIIFAHKMLISGYAPPDDLNEAIIEGLHRHGVESVDAPVVMDDIFDIYTNKVTPDGRR